ncbi:hypothetical protein B296_00053392 [Ensete ventricosum]|uniref:Uncharacterized protein n=1 Tax=Ensete ventricosum TaxID=4639 RepID=A0A426WWX0_ENSVE|nr:hypothetical protein B296_00053392 [Ensete ventricosum]
MFLKLRNFPSEKKVTSLLPVCLVGCPFGYLENQCLSFSFHGAIIHHNILIKLHWQEDGKKKVELKTNFWFEHDKSVTSMLILFAAFPIVGAVVVGLDQYINYYKLQ